jgi:hypothetical protein
MTTPTAALTPDEIEAINAHGPYNHSVWRGRGATISHEEGLTGRVEFLSKMIRQEIHRRYSEEQIRQISITDIGCYDGWLLESLSDIPFKRMVGIEPRAENIRRGQVVRNILGIESRVEYKVGSLESIGDDEAFDVVLCVGVLHHLKSVAMGLAKLRSLCRDTLFVESISVGSAHITDQLKSELELKDVIYKFTPPTCGIIAQKFESAYYPGSGTEMMVVEVPSVETVKMHLEILGFSEIVAVVEEGDYLKALSKNVRPFKALFLTANLGQPKKRDDFLLAYERDLLNTVLADSVIDKLTAWLGGSREIDLSTFAAGSSGVEAEILGSIRFAPEDKISLELGKAQLAKGQNSKAIQTLSGITKRLNADWRACYRAFYLLWRAAEPRHKPRYRELCLTCNPNFPTGLFQERL